MRTRSWRRHQRQRVINHRLFIVTNIWRDNLWPWLKSGSRLSKYNFAHGQCGVCCNPRYSDIPRMNEVTQWLP